MEQTITFHINEQDKKDLNEFAKTQRMSLSSFCRYYLIKVFEDAKLNQTSKEAI